MFEQWWFEELASTNRLAKELLAENGLQKPTVIICKSQTNGQGQKGNNWESEAEKNITASAVLFPKHIAAEDQFILSQLISLAVVDCLAHCNISALVKWPNDIYVGNKKICGILIENQLMGSSIHASVVGIGLNVNQEQFVSDAPNPTSMANERGQTFEVETVLQQLLHCIAARLEQSVVSYDSIREEYQTKLYRRGQQCMFNDLMNDFIGEIVDILPSGMLQIWDHNQQQLRLFAFKEIKFVL